MIKWFTRQLSKGFDTDSEQVNRVTARDATVGFPIMLVVAFVLLVPVLPLILLAELFEFIAALILLICVFAAPITLFAIVDGRGTVLAWVIFVFSSWVLLGRYVFFPIIKQHPRYKRFVRKFL